MTASETWPPPARQSRTLAARGSRFFRARLRKWAQACETFADEPGSLIARLKGWDVSHYGKLKALHRQGVRPKTIYDVGAYNGKWSEMAQAIFSPNEIVLFEPQRRFADSLRQQAQTGEGRSWTVIESALGDAERQTDMHVTLVPSASSLLRPSDPTPQAVGIMGEPRRESITELPLDLLREKHALPPPDLVKIDVQGYEAKVLRGGAETLSCAQVLIVETSIHPQYEGQSLLPEILPQLTGWGFRLYDISETFRWWPGPVWQVDLWMVRNPATPPS